MPGEQDKMYTSQDLQLVKIWATVDSMQKDMSEIKIKMDKHIENSSSGYSNIITSITSMFKDMADGFNKKLDDMKTDFDLHKKENEAKIEYMRTENEATYTKNKDFKLVRSVFSALVVIISLVFFLLDKAK